VTAAEERDDVAGRLADVAWDLAHRIREEDPADVLAWLLAEVPAGELASLAVILAAHIPVDQEQTELLAWWLNPEPTPIAPAFVEPPAAEVGSPYTDEQLHNAYVRYRARRVPVDEIQDHIREGHERYLANQRRSA